MMIAAISISNRRKIVRTAENRAAVQFYFFFKKILTFKTNGGKISPAVQGSRWGIFIYKCAILLHSTIFYSRGTMGAVNFGKKIQNLRKNAGLSMEQLAMKLGVSKSRVNMWENAEVIPRRDMLVKVAAFFNVSTDFLLNSGQDGKEPEAGPEIQIIQRGLKNMDAEQHKKALKILSAAFDDIFNDEEED